MFLFSQVLNSKKLMVETEVGRQSGQEGILMGSLTLSEPHWDNSREVVRIRTGTVLSAEPWRTELTSIQSSRVTPMVMILNGQQK